MEERIVDLFLNLLNMSISASWLIAAVLLLRLVFRKAPKWVNCLLWAIAGLRLILPFSVESVLSLIPSAETVPPEIIYAEKPQISSGIAYFNSAVNPVIGETLAPEVGASANPVQIIAVIFAYLWIIGMAALLIYALISYLKLRHRMKTATLFKDNIYQSERVSSPFVLGIIIPKIYLPYSISDEDAEYVIAHENAHIRRRDHLIKPLAYLLFCVYWFNPLVTVAYVLLCRDIEMACDERVIRQLDEKDRRYYSEALLNCSISRRSIAACPLAFGEVSVKERIKGIMSYKKPAFWVIVVAVLSCIVTAVCFLTNPVKDIQLFGAAYDKGTAVYTYMDVSYLTAIEYYEISEKGDLWQIKDDGAQSWSGILVESDMTRERLMEYIPEEKQKEVKFGRIKKSYELKAEGVIDEERDTKTLFFVTSDGKIYQAMLVKYEGEEILMALVRHEKTDLEFLTENEGFSTVIDTVTADIDSDGKKENCVLTYGPTSGLYTIVFTATEVGSEKAEYINTFNLMYTGGTEFHVSSDGKVQIKCGNTVWQNGETVKTDDVYLDIKIEDGNIALYDGESMVSYWGEQGITPSESFRKMQALENAVGEAVLNNNKGKYILNDRNTEKFSNAASFEEHVILYRIKDDEKETMTVYVQTLYEEFDFNNGVVTSLASGATPVEIVFDISGDGEYKLKKYRSLPKDDDIESFLPEDYGYDEEETMKRLQRDIKVKANRYYGVSYTVHENEYPVVDFLSRYGNSEIPEESGEIKTVEISEQWHLALWDADGGSIFSTSKTDVSSTSSQAVKEKLKQIYKGKSIDTDFIKSDTLECVYFIDEETDEVCYMAFFDMEEFILFVKKDFEEVYAVMPYVSEEEQQGGKIVETRTYSMQIGNRDIEELHIPKLNLVEREKMKTFTLTYDLLSSHLIFGTYEIKGKTLTAAEVNGNVYLFTIKDDETLSFNGKKSSPLPELTDERFGCEIADGDVFVLSARSEA